jgi:hypothetical protein
MATRAERERIVRISRCLYREMRYRSSTILFTAQNRLYMPQAKREHDDIQRVASHADIFYTHGTVPISLPRATESGSLNVLLIGQINICTRPKWSDFCMLFGLGIAYDADASCLRVHTHTERNLYRQSLNEMT